MRFLLFIRRSASRAPRRRKNGRTHAIYASFREKPFNRWTVRGVRCGGGRGRAVTFLRFPQHADENRGAIARRLEINARTKKKKKGKEKKKHRPQNYLSFYKYHQDVVLLYFTHAISVKPFRSHG